MIVSYVGLPGSGKSYGTVENVIVPNIKKGRKIVTNIPLQFSNWESAGLDADLVTVIDLVPVGDGDQADYVFTEGEHEGQSIYDHPLNGHLYILDEIQKNLPAGIRANQLSNNIKTFYSQSRHYIDDQGRVIDIVVITQDLGNVSVFIRKLIAETYRVVNLGFAGADRRYKLEKYHGAVTGEKPPEAKLIKTGNGKYKDSITKLYISHTLIKEDTEFTALDMTKPNSGDSVWSNWRIKYGIPVAIIVLILAVNRMQTVFYGEQPEEKEVKQKEELKPEAREGMRKASFNGQLVEKPSQNIFGISEVYHISMIYQEGDSYKMTITDGERDYPVSSQSCAKVVPYGFVCSIQGQTITEYSGKAFENYGHLHPEGNQNQSSQPAQNPIQEVNPFKTL